MRISPKSYFTKRGMQEYAIEYFLMKSKNKIEKNVRLIDV